MPKRKMLALLALVCLWLSTGLGWSPAQAQTKLPKLKIQTAELPNGLKVVLHEDHRLPLVAIQVWYHVGSKDERPGRTGFAHLFEHLMFKGTKNLPSESIDRLTEDVGGMNNAFTDDDVTVYLEIVPAHHLRRLLWAEADRMGALAVTEENFRSERDVVKEERRQSVENAPYGMVDEILYASVFTKHPYQHTTIGSMEDLNRATLADVNEFHQSFYAPNNATLVLSGDFDSAAILPVIKEYFTPIPASSQPISRITVVEPPQTAERRLTYKDPNAPLPQVRIVFHTPGNGHPDSYALRLLGAILSNGQSSRLYQSLVYQQGLATEASGGGSFSEHPNLFSFVATLAPEKTLPEGEKSLLAEIEKLQTSGVTESELQKAKNQLLASKVNGWQSLMERAEALGRAATFFGDPNRALTDMERLQTVTMADVQAVAKKYFTTENRTVIYVSLPEAAEATKTAGGAK